MSSCRSKRGGSTQATDTRSVKNFRGKQRMSRKESSSICRALARSLKESSSSKQQRTDARSVEISHKFFGSALKECCTTEKSTVTKAVNNHMRGCALPKLKTQDDSS